MDLFEKFSAVSVSAGSRISDLDRFFCEQHQAAYHAARSALLELRCIWEDVEKKQDELLQETKELLSGRNSYTVSRDLSITDARLKELLMEQPCSFVQNLVHYFNRTYHTALSADAILQRMLPEKPEYRRRDEEAWAAYEEAVLARKLTYTEVVEQLLAQMDGRQFEEQALFELRHECHKAAWWRDGTPKFERKKDMICFTRSACTYNDSYRSDYWTLSSDMKSILRGLACFETGSVSVFPYRFSDLLGYGNILENQIAFSTCDKVKQLRLFKNGRVDLKFSSEQTAADFVDTYLGTVY